MVRNSRKNVGARGKKKVGRSLRQLPTIELNSKNFEKKQLLSPQSYGKIRQGREKNRLISIHLHFQVPL
jgi:hypothetical protein